MLLVLLRAVVAASEREDERVFPLQLAQPAQRARVIGQLVIGENSSGNDVRTHSWTRLIKMAWCSRSSLVSGHSADRYAACEVITCESTRHETPRRGHVPAL